MDLSRTSVASRDSKNPLPKGSGSPVPVYDEGA